MSGALRKLFVELDVKVNKKPLDESVSSLRALLRSLNRLKKISTKKLEKSLKSTNSAIKSTEKDSKKLDKNLGKASKSSQDLSEGAKKTKKEFKGLSQIIQGIAHGIGMAVASFGISGIRTFITNTMESTNELARWSGRLRIGVDELNSWAQMSSMFGADLDDVTDAFKELQLKGRDALDGTKTYIDIFETIGISTDDLRENINDLPGLMDLFTDRLNTNTDAATRSFVVDELMSDAGTRMIEVFQLGTTEISRRRRALQRQSGPMQELVKVNEKFTLALAELNIAFTNIRNKVLIRVMPVLTKLTIWGKWAIQNYPKLKEKIDLLASAVIVLGIAFGKSAIIAIAAWAPAIAMFLFWTAGILAAVLLVEDLIVTIKGGDSAIKHFLKSIGMWEPLVGFLERIWRGAQRVGQILERMGRGAQRVGSHFQRMWRGVQRAGQALRSADRWLSSLLVKIDQLISRTSSVSQFWGTFLGGSTAEEVGGTGQLAEESRTAAADAENWRDSTADFLETIGPLGGLPGFVGMHALRAMGSGQRDRRTARSARAAQNEATDQRITRARRIRATEQQASFNLFGPDPMQEHSMPGTAQDVRVNQQNQTTINITGVSSPDEIASAVDSRLSQRENERARGLQNALVPESRR